MDITKEQEADLRGALSALARIDGDCAEVQQRWVGMPRRYWEKVASGPLSTLIRVAKELEAPTAVDFANATASEIAKQNEKLAMMKEGSPAPMCWTTQHADGSVTGMTDGGTVKDNDPIRGQRTGRLRYKAPPVMGIMSHLEEEWTNPLTTWWEPVPTVSEGQAP